MQRPFAIGDTLYRHRFFADGVELEAHEPPPVPLHAGYEQRLSRTGRWYATITGKHELRVSEKVGRSHEVDMGRYDNCEGVTIRINGWIDDEHLVYESNHSTYVYSAADRSKSLLFDEGEEQLRHSFGRRFASRLLHPRAEKGI